jgi:hypothetical protein
LELRTTLGLGRLTTQYHEQEDRIRITGEIETGGTACLWLTNRLARRLVPALVRWLEQESGDLPMPELRQEMAQQAAEARMEAGAPVGGGGAVAFNLLLQEIDLQATDQAIRLVLKTGAEPGSGAGSGSGAVFAFGFDRTSARQWLAILRHGFEQAGWPQDIWPEWSKSAAPSEAAGWQRSLH